MNEAETKIVEHFIEMMKRKSSKIESWIGNEAYSVQEKMIWSDHHKTIMSIIEAPEYQALKDSVENCSLCYQREWEFEGSICPRCGKSNDIVEDKPDEDVWITWREDYQPEDTKGTRIEYLVTTVANGATTRYLANADDITWTNNDSHRITSYRIAEEPKKQNQLELANRLLRECQISSDAEMKGYAKACDDFRRHLENKEKGDD